MQEVYRNRLLKEVLIKMAKKETTNKTIIYGFDPDEEYTYNDAHGSIYPENGFPPGWNGKRYKKTRFINWEPYPEDIFIRHYGSQIHCNFAGVKALAPTIRDMNICLFQMRAKRLDLHNLICEQINFFTALYDDDNDLITSMYIAKYKTDSQTYTIKTFEEFYIDIFDTLFPRRTIDKIQRMVEENDVGDEVVGLFPLDFLRDVYMVSFMIKVMHLFVEHFIISTGNSPKDLFELFARAVTHIMNTINPNMYRLLYNYVNKNVLQTIAANTNIYDMQSIEGVTQSTTTMVTMRRTLLCDGLIKLTFASEWDKINKRPTFSCVGLIKAIINQASFLARRTQLKKSLVSVDDMSQLLNENISSSSPISTIRSFNPGEYCCMTKDLNIIIGQIALDIDVSCVDYYLDHLVSMNDLSELMIQTVLYNRFHSSININTLSLKQKFILLLYVRRMIMDIYNLNEEDTPNSPLINILMGKVVTSSEKSLTQKDLNNIKKYIKLNNLKDYLLSEKNVTMYIENIMNCVMASYTVVNHNAPDLLDTPLVYESGQMTLQLLDMVVEIFERMYD